MRAEEAQTKFRDADVSYRAGRYTEAIVVLDELEHAFPGDRHILFPRARCLAKLGREAEAIALCDILIQEHAYEKARTLKKRLQLGEAPEQDQGLDDGDLSFSALQIELEEPETGSAFNRPPVLAAKSGPNWGLVLIALLVALALGVGAYWFTQQSGSGEDSGVGGDGSGSAATLPVNP